MIIAYKDPEVYKRSFKMAMEFLWLTKNFPKEETYSLTSQVIRFLRSVSANISEGWSKGKYEFGFRQHLIHSFGSCPETQTWFAFALSCEYIEKDFYIRFTNGPDQICKIINKLHQNWKSNGK